MNIKTLFFALMITIGLGLAACSSEETADAEAIDSTAIEMAAPAQEPAAVPASNETATDASSEDKSGVSVDGNINVSTEKGTSGEVDIKVKGNSNDNK